TALSGGRNNAVTDIYADLDSTRAFDYPLRKVAEPPAGPCHVTGGGAIAGTGTDAMFTVNAHADLKGKLDYREGAAINFRSTKLNKVECSGTSARIEGEGVNNGVSGTFIVDVVDNGEPGTNDTFSISIVPPGYAKSGKLIRGNIQVHK
ncbi:MAG TPA: post-COAP-1 domain-containing protein, partial [Pyrinomonadaceae bacterium]|nr:post-COAP-1 domain-containing protein [Pyrinomonadaceae bacterium]